MTGFGNSDLLVDQVGFVNHGSKQIHGVGFANPDSWIIHKHLFHL
jgi:hypothetical protein